MKEVMTHCHTGQDVDILNGLHLALELHVVSDHNSDVLISNARKPE